VKIMIHSNAPWVPSGYGKQTALAIRALASLDHEVAVSATHGVSGARIEWNGVPVYPAGTAPWGIDVLVHHANHYGADVILTLMDTWALMPIADHLAEVLQRPGAPRLVCWTPVDCDPISQGDRVFLRRSGALPLAMSQFGLNMMHQAGLHNAQYVPHAFDPAVYRLVLNGGEELRAQVGTRPDQFVIGILAANRDMFRKAWQEQFQAFALHLRDWPHSELWVHTIADGRRIGGFNLREMATDLGIGQSIRFVDEYPQTAGLIDDEDLAEWYGAINLLSNCSYGEGFGLPIVEAQACGTPAIATDASAMQHLATEVVGGQRWWNAVHQAWWVRPDAQQICRAYNRYRDQWHQPTEAPPQSHAEWVSEFALDEVTAKYWAPVLDSLGGAA
jgi:glycosyltransferase involved in cell wall biosynthesis